MLRRLVAVGLALHGLIHLIGFVVPFRLAELEGFGYTTSAAWGRIELGDAGARAVGLVWLIVAAAFVLAAFGVWRNLHWAAPVTAVLAAVSIVVCVLGSPSAAAGIVIDVVILAAIGSVSFLPNRSRSLVRPR